MFFPKQAIPGGFLGVSCKSHRGAKTHAPKILRTRTKTQNKYLGRANKYLGRSKKTPQQQNNIPEEQNNFPEEQTNSREDPRRASNHVASTLFACSFCQQNIRRWCSTLAQRRAESWQRCCVLDALWTDASAHGFFFGSLVGLILRPRASLTTGTLLASSLAQGLWSATREKAHVSWRVVLDTRLKCGQVVPCTGDTVAHRDEFRTWAWSTHELHVGASCHERLLTRSGLPSRTRSSGTTSGMDPSMKVSCPASCGRRTNALMSVRLARTSMYGAR